VGPSGPARFMPTILGAGTVGYMVTISVYCLHVTSKDDPRILPALCSASCTGPQPTQSLAAWS
jgi:hypothetical protein